MKSTILYYGTSLDYSEQIDKVGIISKDKICLTTDITTAYENAIKTIYSPNSSCLQPVICTINVTDMIKDGFIFEHNSSYTEYYVSSIPSKYINQVAVETEEDLMLLARYEQQSCC